MIEIQIKLILLIATTTLMSTFKIIFLLLFFLSFCSEINAQGNTKSKFEIMLLGNRSFVSAIYSRRILDTKGASFMMSFGAGIVPGSHDKDTIPSTLQLGIGPSVEIGKNWDKLVIGITYSAFLKISKDKKNSEIGNLFGGVVFDIGYARYFKNDDTVLKILFTPVLFGKEYRDNFNIPVGLSFGMTF